MGVHWLELGEGRPLVLLHGLNDAHVSWARVARSLAKERRVLMPDLPGHGLSDRPDASYALRWYAEVMVAWLDALGIQEFDLAGHSFGGGVAQQLLLLCEGRVDRLALIAPGGLGREVALGLRLASMTNLVERCGQPLIGMGTRLLLRSLGEVFADDEAAWLAWANAMPGSARAFSRTVRDVIDWRGQRRSLFDEADVFGRAWPATALFWGAIDPVVPVWQGVQLSRLLEGCTLTVFPRCGHFPHRECPVALTKALQAFLAEPASPVSFRQAPHRSRGDVARGSGPAT